MHGNLNKYPHYLTKYKAMADFKGMLSLNKIDNYGAEYLQTSACRFSIRALKWHSLTDYKNIPQEDEICSRLWVPNQQK